MKILKFSVNNYRGINGGLETNTIEFEASNAIFIFGQNNVGKSSFLKSYMAFYDDKVNKDDFTHGTENDIEIEIHLKVDDELDQPIIDAGTGNKFRNLKTHYLGQDNVLKLRRKWLFADKGVSLNKETYNTTTSSWEAVAYGGIGLHNAFQPLVMKPLFIEAMPTEMQVQDIVSDVLKEVAARKLSDTQNTELQDAIQKISDLQDIIYSKTSIDTYKGKVNDRFKTLFDSYEIDIDDGVSKAKFTQDKIGKEFKINFKRTDSSQPSSYMQMGHGAVRMAIFLLMLMRDELREAGVAAKNFLVLFEEPELFLHPTLTKKLRELIYEVSGNDMPFQVLCASHSPQMVDITKDHTSLVRMVRADDAQTSLYQIEREDLINAEQASDDDIKQKIYELLRFDPFLCESFYADEVLLVEGDTEAIILRGYEQAFGFNKKDIFVVNCHSVTNIPFYQKIFAKFNIPYSVICDTDHTSNVTGWDGNKENPKFTAQVQKTISEQFEADNLCHKSKFFLVFPETFEPCHEDLNGIFKFDASGSEGKPFKANRYWSQIIAHKDEAGFNDVPIVNYVRKIIT